MISKAELIRRMENDTQYTYYKIKINKIGEITGMRRDQDWTYNKMTNTGGRRFVGQYGDYNMMEPFDYEQHC